MSFLKSLCCNLLCFSHGENGNVYQLTVCLFSFLFAKYWLRTKINFEIPNVYKTDGQKAKHNGALFSLATVMHDNKCHNGFLKRWFMFRFSYQNPQHIGWQLLKYINYFCLFCFHSNWVLKALVFHLWKKKTPSQSRIWNSLEQKKNAKWKIKQLHRHHHPLPQNNSQANQSQTSLAQSISPSVWCYGFFF